MNNLCVKEEVTPKQNVSVWPSRLLIIWILPTHPTVFSTSLFYSLATKYVEYCIAPKYVEYRIAPVEYCIAPILTFTYLILRNNAVSVL